MKGRDTVTTREKCHTLLDELSDTMLEKIAGYLNALKQADETDDMDFCIELYDNAKAADDGYRISASDLRAKYGI